MKKKGLCLFFLVFLCVCISPGKHLFAQKFNIQQYTANTGLPSNNVFDVEFDDDGNIWFATSDGVVKYDGATYRTFNQDDGLVDPVLFDIFIDDAGTLWASTDLGGVAKYEQGKFVYPQELDWIDSTIVHYIGQDNEGNLWLSLDNAGFVILDREDLSIKQKITIEQGLPSDLMFHFNFQYSDRVFISTYAGVAVYSYADNAIVDVWNMADGLIGEKTYEVLIDQQENIWIGTDQGVSVIHPDGSTTNKETVANYRLGYVFAIEQSYDGKIWIGTDRSGLFWINGEQETHITVRNGISSNNIFNLSKSPTGEIWISTNGNGVNIFIDDEFKIYDESSELDAYSATTVLQAKDGAIWVSTEHGISSFVDGAFKNYPILLESFENELILRSAELPNGNILMITNNYSLIEFDGERFFESEYANLLQDELISEIEIIDETIWFMALRHVISDTDGEIRYHSPETTDQWKTEFNYIYKDSRGLIWMGTQGGLVHYRDDNFTYYTISDGLRNNRVSHINEDESGNLWIAHNAGIDILRGVNDDGNFEEVVPFETADLYIDETNFLQFDAAGNLWQGTDAGLNYYNLDAFEETGTYQHINIPLQNYGNGTEFSTYGSVLSNDSTLYFGTYNSGLVSYKFTNGENKLLQEAAPKVIIRSIMAGTEQVYNQEEKDADLERIEVENSQNSITIKLSALSEKYPRRINYRYRLSGLQDDWVIAENISQIRYESLPSGTFNLILQTKAPNSDWSAVQQGIRIVVKKPFYFQGWFLGIILLAIAFLIYGIDKGRVSLIEKNLLASKVDEQTKDIQKALDEKEVLIKEIHHRVKNNLAVISGLLDLQSRQIEEGPATEALQNSMTRVLAMAKIHEQLYQNEDLSNVNFKRFITNLVRSLDNTISNADHPILINEQVADISVDVNVGVPLGLMINEILSNSFKHAFEGQDAIHLATINIEFSKISDQFYHMRIADNGVGSAENLLEIEHQSLGMTLIKSWAMQLDAELSYDGANGAVFEAKIPV
jgi:two-component sensor histidine kinase/ligand-binding sensor domain-containing protein